MTCTSPTLKESFYRHLNGYLFNTGNLIKVSLLLLSLSGCNEKNSESVKVFHEGSYTIRAKFVNGKSNGETQYYDNSGKLTGIINYRDDEKWGICRHYFPNGSISDSVEYVCDKEQGYWRHYDQNGNPTHFAYYYFGLQYGPDLWYDKDKVLRYFNFLNFERQPIVECIYNRHGYLDSIVKVDLTVYVDEREKNGTPLYKFFAYLPRIPLADLVYSVGVVGKDSVTQKKLFDIEGKGFFIDTMLAAPPAGSHFYLDCDLKANKGKYHETIRVEAIKKDGK